MKMAIRYLIITLIKAVGPLIPLLFRRYYSFKQCYVCQHLHKYTFAINLKSLAVHFILVYNKLLSWSSESTNTLTLDRGYLWLISIMCCYLHLVLSLKNYTEFLLHLMIWEILLVIISYFFSGFSPSHQVAWANVPFASVHANILRQHPVAMSSAGTPHILNLNLSRKFLFCVLRDIR